MGVIIVSSRKVPAACPWLFIGSLDTKEPLRDLPTFSDPQRDDAFRSCQTQTCAWKSGEKSNRGYPN
jgi:hypothetical protein